MGEGVDTRECDSVLSVIFTSSLWAGRPLSRDYAWPGSSARLLVAGAVLAGVEEAGVEEAGVDEAGGIGAGLADGRSARPGVVGGAGAAVNPNRARVSTGMPCCALFPCTWCVPRSVSRPARRLVGSTCTSCWLP